MNVEFRMMLLAGNLVESLRILRHSHCDLAYVCTLLHVSERIRNLGYAKVLDWPYRMNVSFGVQSRYVTK
jgi:hypothetical protein